MPRTLLERHTERLVLAAASVAGALVAALAVEAVQGASEPLAALLGSAPLAVLVGLGLSPVVVWGLEGTELWRSLPLLAGAALACSALGALLGPWPAAALGVTAACSGAGWIRLRRHAAFGATRPASGYRPRSARPRGPVDGPPEA